MVVSSQVTKALNLSPQLCFPWHMGELKEPFVNFFAPLCVHWRTMAIGDIFQTSGKIHLYPSNHCDLEKWNCESLLPHLKTSVWHEEFCYGCRSWQQLKGQGSAGSSCCAPHWAFRSSALLADQTAGRVAITQFFGMAKGLFWCFLLIAPSQMLWN